MRGSRGAAWIVAAVLGSLLVESPTFADERDDFRDGVKAYDEQRWAESERSMRAAIAQRPHADNYKVTVFSSVRVAYVPNTFLTIALAKQSRCEEALGALERAEAQGVAARNARNYFREALDLGNQCRSQLSRGAADDAQNEIEKARSLAEAVREAVAGGSGAEVLSRVPSLSRRIDEAEQMLRSALQQLQTGVQGSSLPTLRQAAQMGQRAATEWGTIRRDLNIELAKAGPATPTVAAELEPARVAVAAARQARQALADQLRLSAQAQTLRRTTRLRQRWEASGRTLQDLEDRLTSATEANDGDALRQIDSEASTFAQRLSTLRGEIEGATRQRIEQERRARAERDTAESESEAPARAGAEPAEVPPDAPTAAPNSPSTLEAPSPPSVASPVSAEEAFAGAVRRYFRGDYEGSFEQLDGFTFRDQPALEAERRLLRAAALFSLARASADEERAATLLEQAREALEQLAEVNADLEIPADWFSPAFRAFAAAL